MLSDSEIERLRGLYTSPATRREIEAAFSGHTWGSLRGLALRRGWKRGVAHGNQHGRQVGQAVPSPAEPQAPPSPRPPSEQVQSDRQIAALRSENQLLRTKYQAALREANLQDRILEYAKLSIDSLPPVKSPPPPPVKTGQAVESAVMVWSCHHIGEVVNASDMGNLNSYDFDTFVRRLQVLVERCIAFTTTNMRTHRFDELHILHTGDAVSGIIHDELEQTNELTIVEQAFLGALVTAQALQDLARAFPRIVFTGVVGNHGRVKHQKYFKGKASINWDFVFYNTLAMLLQHQRNIEFNIPLSYWAGISIRGWRFLIQHGDGIKSWSSIPFYGIQREVAKWREVKAVQEEYFQYFVASHFHTRAVLQTSVGENILNGSLKGGDEYAIGLSLFNRPSQLLFGVHEKHGKTWEIAIDPSRGQDEVETRYRYDRSIPLAKQLLQ